MTKRLTAGARLLRAMEESRKHVEAVAGKPVSWDPSDTIALHRAAEAADRSEQLRAKFNDELGGQARPTSLTRISGEMRALDRLVIEVTRRLNAELQRMTRQVDARKQRAADYRWSRRNNEGVADA